MSRVVVTGATGNVGSSLVEALSADPRVDRIVGISRRRSGREVDKVTWCQADVTTADLTELFAGADAVIHLAWLLQPTRDEATTWEVNVRGSARVLDAVTAASVPAVVVASSIGAYSPGPKDRRVDESWPTHGVATSSYSRQKAYVERLLDGLETAHPNLRVVRLRPGLVLQGRAGAEIRRYFAGPLLPSALIAPGRLPVFPRMPGVSTQFVHTDDVARAFLLAALGDVAGAFNVAAEPPLDMGAMAASLGARAVTVPAPLVRALAATTWHLRLQPTDPGWIDLAVNSPLMDTTRARDELGWRPTHSATDAFVELVAGMAHGSGGPSAPLRPDSAAARVDELRTGLGAQDH